MKTLEKLFSTKLTSSNPYGRYRDSNKKLPAYKSNSQQPSPQKHVMITDSDSPWCGHIGQLFPEHETDGMIFFRQASSKNKGYYIHFNPEQYKEVAQL